MANNSLVYSNARVKAMENSFLTNEKIVRMAYADSLEEGIKILLESSYGGGILIEGNDYETLLQAEDRRKFSYQKRLSQPQSDSQGKVYAT